ncbi:carboxypeptidase-like regulatory domain-containing protein [Fulvivirga maritima]|uniref:carboxypeptidase-like regulatory domain-containing protein n=1 Tax=Fulvivirga maritima TaxID=2904247 RepID=UPI001F418B1D|nr:carboxypeptidase-like regulatory domain-containing protein [Fulvivirga maritima]UII26393.1 carboxypeptidase-like regulatory domain-containing protein [Fulvivirga maritima]
MKIKFTSTLFALAKRVVPPKVGSVFLLVCVCVFSLAIKVSAQDANISIPETRQYSTTEVFDLIKKQTNYTFVYRSDLFNGQPAVNISEGNIKTADLLKLSLGNNFSYEYSAEDNTIIVSPKTSDDNINSSAAGESVAHRVTGVVSDETGETLAGVSVIIQGQARGTITDTDGRYALNVKPENTLIYSFLGYKRKEISVGASSQIDVVLEESLTTLSEVQIVSTGYQKNRP